MDVSQVLVSDLRQCHGGDIQLGVLNELQEQVEGPVINGDSDGVTAGLVAELGLANAGFHRQADYIIPVGDIIPAEGPRRGKGMLRTSSLKGYNRRRIR